MKKIDTQGAELVRGRMPRVGGAAKAERKTLAKVESGGGSVQIYAATNPVNPGGLVQTDGTTIAGSGVGKDPLVVTGGGGIPVVADGVSITGDGTTAHPLATVPDRTAVLTDGVTTTGNGTTGNPIISLASAGTTIYFNVKAYGATGNGVTDDTTAIRSAIAACQAAGGGTVYFPNGTYLISEHASSFICLQINTGVSLLGQSREGVVLFLAPNQRASVRPIYVGPNAADLSISWLTVDGNKAGQTIPDEMHRDEIFLDTTTRVAIEYVETRNGTGSGVVVFSNSVDTTIDNLYSHDNVWMGVAWGSGGGQRRTSVFDAYCINNAAGLHIEATEVFQAGDILLDHCYCDATTGNYAIQVSGGNGGGLEVEHVIVRSCTVNLTGILVADAVDVVVRDCYVSGSDTLAMSPALPIEVAGDATDVWILNNEIVMQAGSTGRAAVWVVGNTGGIGTDNVNVIGNAIDVLSTTADGVQCEASGTVRVLRNQIRGNASMATGHYGVNFSQMARNSDSVEICGNYVADFNPIGIVTQSPASSIKVNDVDISGNRFEAITVGLMTSCIGFGIDTRTSILQASAQWNRCIGTNQIPLISHYPNGIPLLIGGNWGDVEILSVATSPAGVVTAPIGSQAVARDTGVWWQNRTGLSSGWHSVNVT